MRESAGAGKRGHGTPPVRHQRFSTRNIPSKNPVYFGIKKDLIDVFWRTSIVFSDDYLSKGRPN
jgi:hypothetical protein